MRYLLLSLGSIFLLSFIACHDRTTIAYVQDPCKGVDPIYIGKKGENGGDNVMQCYDYVIMSYQRFRGLSR